MTGVLMAIPPADFVLHNSLFLIAHFHNVVIGGVIFGSMAGYTYWFPKAFGFTLHEGLGKAIFWCWTIGFYLAFVPLYALGLMGATRRMQHYDDPSWQPLMQLALLGAVFIFAGIVLTVVQLVVSIRTRDRRRDLTGDPWDGRTLEWSTSSPPPPWNFSVLPRVTGIDAFWTLKEQGRGVRGGKAANYEAIDVPRHSAMGFLTALFAVILGFAAIWHIWWMAILGLGCAIAVLLIHSWQMDTDIEVSAREVADLESRRLTPPEPA
jgi:cytochrome o ubiquinol oxidase subunit 1